ncbi:MAG: hypothetical protein IJW50_03395 [Clostridia bacterium]|nr:hypothetical protein [Clostridia bacterium]
MENALFDQARLKRLKRQFLIFLIACVVFIAAVYTPVYLLLSSNVLWSNSIFLLLWMELLEPLMNFAFYWGSFAYTVYACVRFSTGNAKRFFVYYGVAVVARYLFPMVVSFCIMSFPGWNDLFKYELPGVLFSILLDALQMAVIVVLCQVRLSRSFDGVSGAQIMERSLPFERLVDFKSPLPQMCMLCSLVPSALQLLSRLYYDIFFYGLPQKPSEWILVLTYYIGDLACFMIGYFVVQFLVQTLYTAEVKSRADFEEN